MELQSFAQALLNSRSLNEELRQDGLRVCAEALQFCRENGQNYQSFLNAANALNGSNSRSNSRRSASRFGSNYRR